MAANSYLQLGPSTYRGGQIVQMHALLVQLMELTAEVSGALSQAQSDDPNDAAGKIAVLLGTGTAQTPQAVLDAAAARALVGTINTNLLNGANAFMQFRDRIAPNN